MGLGYEGRSLRRANADELARQQSRPSFPCARPCCPVRFIDREDDGKLWKGGSATWRRWQIILYALDDVGALGFELRRVSLAGFLLALVCGHVSTAQFDSSCSASERSWTEDPSGGRKTERWRQRDGTYVFEAFALVVL